MSGLVSFLLIFLFSDLARIPSSTPKLFWGKRSAGSTWAMFWFGAKVCKWPVWSSLKMSWQSRRLSRLSWGWRRCLKASTCNTPWPSCTPALPEGRSTTTRRMWSLLPSENTSPPPLSWAFSARGRLGLSTPFSHNCCRILFMATQRLLRSSVFHEVAFWAVGLQDPNT